MYGQFIHYNRRGKAEYVNIDGSRLVILVMGECESYSDWFYFFHLFQSPIHAGIPCVVAERWPFNLIWIPFIGKHFSVSN